MDALNTDGAGGPSPHTCFETVDAMLAEKNTRLVFPLMLGGDQTLRPMIETERIQKLRDGKKAVVMFATFCPFCGVKLA